MAYMKSTGLATNDFSATKKLGGAGTNYNANDINLKITDAFRNTKDFKDVTSYRLMRGVPDFGTLVQFNPYETGYAAFIICQMPKFIEVLAEYNESYNKLMKNWMHIVEYEFKDFSGIEGITADTIELGDDLNKINVINRVNMQSASEFSLTYDEKSGSPLTKFAKLYLTGIKDPRTQVKTYHGLIHNKDANGNSLLEPGFENEVFSFLFFATDNTMTHVEAAYLIIGAQLNSADTDMYNYTKGDISKKEVTVKFSGYPITGSVIEAAAQDMLSYLITAKAGARQIIVNSNEFEYAGTDRVAKTLSNYIETAGVPNLDTASVKNSYSTIRNANSAVQYTTNSFYGGTTNYTAEEAAGRA